MISTDKPVSAEKADQIGRIDGIADDPVAVAKHLDIGTVLLSAVVGNLQHLS